MRAFRSVGIIMGLTMLAGALEARQTAPAEASHRTTFDRQR